MTKIFIITLGLFLAYSCGVNPEPTVVDRERNFETDTQAISNEKATDSTLALHDNSDKFNDAIKLIEQEFGYISQETSGSKLYKTRGGISEYLYLRFKKTAEYEPKINEINFDLIQSVKSAYVKSEKPIEDKLYLKVDIEEWKFENEKIAEDFKLKLDGISIQQRERINKGGMTWWRIENKLYVLITGTYRYSFEFDKIETVLNKKL